MAKMFYTIEEAAAKLGKSVDSVRDMAAKGQLQEFKDRDRLMFKVEQVDLLAGGDDHIPLVESGESEALSLGASGTGLSLDNPKEATGISIVDMDATEEADANAVTRVTQSPVNLQDPGKSGSGSGAGLLDLTKEADDTSLGAGLLEDVYGNETVAQQTAAEPAIGGGGESAALFETGPTEVSEPTAVGMMVAAEPYDPVWSSVAGWLCLGTVVALLMGVFTTVVGLAGAAGGGMMSKLGDSWMIIVGGMAGIVVLCGIIGFALGKKG